MSWAHSRYEFICRTTPRCARRPCSVPVVAAGQRPLPLGLGAGVERAAVASPVIREQHSTSCGEYSWASRALVVFSRPDRARGASEPRSVETRLTVTNLWSRIGYNFLIRLAERFSDGFYFSVEFFCSSRDHRLFKLLRHRCSSLRHSCQSNRRLHGRRLSRRSRVCRQPSL